jgi:hypothetical protein
MASIRFEVVQPVLLIIFKLKVFLLAVSSKSESTNCAGNLYFSKTLYPVVYISPRDKILKPASFLQSELGVFMMVSLIMTILPL